MYCYMRAEGSCQLSSDMGGYTDPDGSKFIKWAGLLINTLSLNIRADYTRHVHCTKFVRRIKLPGTHLPPPIQVLGR